MKLRVSRRWYTRRSTIGQWYCDNEWQCDTLEDRVRADSRPGTPSNEAKVYGETAIPALVYLLALEKPQRAIWSPRNGKDLPEDDGKLIRLYWRDSVTGRVGEVPGYTGIFVHALNKPDESLGCIGAGRRDPIVPDWIGESRATLTALMKKVCPAIEAGETRLEIEEFGRPPDEVLA